MKGIGIRVKGSPIGAMILAIIALSLKLLVPTGYMVQPQDSGITISVCSDSSGIAKTIGIPVEHGGKNSSDRHQANSPCPYTALALVALAVTGLAMWRRRKPDGSLGAPHSSLSEAQLKTVAAITLLLALLMPLLALSLIAILLMERLVLRFFPGARQWLGFPRKAG